MYHMKEVFILVDVMYLITSTRQSTGHAAGGAVG